MSGIKQTQLPTVRMVVPYQKTDVQSSLKELNRDPDGLD